MDTGSEDMSENEAEAVNGERSMSEDEDSNEPAESGEEGAGRALVPGESGDEPDEDMEEEEEEESEEDSEDPRSKRNSRRQVKPMYKDEDYESGDEDEDSPAETPASNKRSKAKTTGHKESNGSKKGSRVAMDREEEDEEEYDRSSSQSDVDIEEEDDDEEEVTPAPKRRKIVSDDEGSKRRSGRERKVPKKFEVAEPETGKKKVKKKKRRIESEEEQEESDDQEEQVAQSKKRKRPKSKKAKKGNQKQKEPKVKEKKSKKKAKEVKKVVKKKKEYETVKRKQRAMDSSVENSEVSEIEDDEYAREYRKTMENKRKQTGNKISMADYGDKKSTRQKDRQRVKYAEEDESHSSDVRSDLEEMDFVGIEEDIDHIDFVLDHRKGKKGATGESTMHFTVQAFGDPNETLETDEKEDQYYIKWKDWSHINNTWESMQSLEARKKGDQPVKGLRKIVNYMNKVDEYEAWKKTANPEDIEFGEIDIEMGRELLKTYVEIERIFSSRKNEKSTLDYFVKWKNLPYSEATWEDDSVINAYYAEVLEDYNIRKKCKNNPKNYRESMKHVKKKFLAMKEQPEYVGSDELRLRDYQMEGVNFVLDAWHKGNSVILADEMGLGKTIQTICFLKYLFHNYPFKGPMLCCVPLSTMAAWQKEFEQWAPDMNVIAYIGDAKSREIIRQFELEDQKTGELMFNVLLTNYEMVCKDRNFFSEIAWSNIVVDEAHRLKSDGSLLYKVLQELDSHHRLLLTGTPLQNSLKELWCLLSYIRPPELEDWETFEMNYGSKQDQEGGYVKLHTLLKPYIIRRLKKDVEKSLPRKVEQILRVDMTLAQKKLYKLVLTKNFDALSKGKNQVSLLNIMMQLRKTCNHAHLMQEPDPNPDMTQDECLKQMIYGSGKLLLLDKLLTRFREKGDRVLIFSQMVIMLNILEDYLRLKRYPFQRLDGGVNCERRKQSIAQFNSPNSPDFCFLLSTKAGGLGINLQTANRVVIFDSDFNPQNDLQAIARAHRIGQKEEVKIYRLVASNSVDEDIIHRAKKKMVLDHLVIQRMDTTGRTVVAGHGQGPIVKDGKQPFNKDELNMILKFGAEELFKEEEEKEEVEREKEVDLDSILEKAETREEEEAPQSEANKELLSAFKCTTLTFEETEKEVHEGDEQDEEEEKFPDWQDIIPSELRQRKTKAEELFSDPEELFNPIAHRKRKRNKKRIELDSNAPSVASSLQGSNAGSDSDSGSDSDQEDENEAVARAKKRPSYKAKFLQCAECGKGYNNSGNLVNHMVKKHGVEGFQPAPENFISESPAPSGTESPVVGSESKRRGKKPMNTRCFPCGRTFQNRIGYKSHLKNKHNGVEPPENRDPKNLALPDDRISCLLCQKKFQGSLGLKGHIQRVHLGLAADKVDKDSVNDEANDNDIDEDADGKETENKNSESQAQQDPVSAEAPVNGAAASTASEAEPLNGGSGDISLPVAANNDTEVVKTESNDQDGSKSQMVELSEDDRRLIEKMYYLMRKHACKYCNLRFSSKGKWMRHEGIHLSNKKPVVCPHCDISYSRRDKLKNHIENTHAGKSLPLYCPQSPRRTVERSEVLDYTDIVQVPVKFETGSDSRFELSEDNRYACPDCDLTFPFLKGAQKHHKIVHGPPKTFKCRLCPLSYHDSKGLYQHMFRKHPKGHDQAMSENSDAVDSDSGASNSVEVVESETKKYACPACPFTFPSSSSLYLHKKAKHPDHIRPYRSSPLINGAAISKVQMNGAKPKEKEYICRICDKMYSSYMSLYMHRKTKHQGQKEAISIENSMANGEVAVLGINNMTVTPNGRREKVHQCGSCHKRYADLKGLAKHVEDKHAGSVSIQVVKKVPQKLSLSPGFAAAKASFGCPYCSRRFLKIEEVKYHIKLLHQGHETPKKSRPPTTEAGDDDDIVCLGDVNNLNTSELNRSGKGKLKEKNLSCPHCSKAYCDQKRLDNHIQLQHSQVSGLSRGGVIGTEVIPNSDIVVANANSKSGYDIYKVLGYAGDKLRCAKFSAIEHDTWMLTEQIDNNVEQNDIKLIVKSMRLTDQEKVYCMDSDELVKVLQVVSQEADKPGSGDTMKNGEDYEEYTESGEEPEVVEEVIANGGEDEVEEDVDDTAEESDDEDSNRNDAREVQDEDSLDDEMGEEEEFEDDIEEIESENTDLDSDQPLQ